MLPDEVNKKLIMKSVVKVFIEFEAQLTLSFACYYQTNYQKKRIVGLVLEVPGVE
jgi:hypothetical protein